MNGTAPVGTLRPRAPRWPIAAAATFGPLFGGAFAAQATMTASGLSRSEVGATLLATAVQLLAVPVAFRFIRRWRVATLVSTAMVIAAAPLLVPSEARVLRIVVACCSVVFVIKLYDLHVHLSLRRQINGSGIARFVTSPYYLVLRKMADEPGPERRRVIIDLAGAAAGLVSCMLLFGIVSPRALWVGQPFLIEHVAKAVPLFFFFCFGLAITVAVVRLSGAPACDFTRTPLLAVTPADFWRRYNRPMQQFFDHDIFRRSGGRRAPVLVTLLIFTLSGVAHEYIFMMALGTIQGYQMAFFLVQGVAVAATLRVRPKGPTALVWTMATAVFMLISSVLFFASVHQVVRFYSRGVPPALWG